MIEFLKLLIKALTPIYFKNKKYKRDFDISKNPKNLSAPMWQQAYDNLLNNYITTFMSQNFLKSHWEYPTENVDANTSVNLTCKPIASNNGLILPFRIVERNVYRTDLVTKYQGSSIKLKYPIKIGILAHFLSFDIILSNKNDCYLGIYLQKLENDQKEFDFLNIFNYNSDKKISVGKMKMTVRDDNSVNSHIGHSTFKTNGHKEISASILILEYHCYFFLNKQTVRICHLDELKGCPMKLMITTTPDCKSTDNQPDGIKINQFLHKTGNPRFYKEARIE